MNTTITTTRWDCIYIYFYLLKSMLKAKNKLHTGMIFFNSEYYEEF